jgi:transcription antitermination protein NusB
MARWSARRAARKAALDILYEADLLERPVASVLAERLQRDEELDAYALALVRGVERNRVALDGLIEANARDWRLSRMPVVDRNLLRLGLFEILHCDDVPMAVAIDEAVELAKALSTDDSPRFVNGVLARIGREHQP